MEGKERPGKFRRPLAMEPLEDRVLLSLQTANGIISRPASSVSDVAEATAPISHAAIPADVQSHELSARPADHHLADRLIDWTDAGRSDKRDEPADEWREHAVIEWARIARMEAESVAFLVPPSVAAVHDLAVPPAVVIESDGLLPPSGPSMPRSPVVDLSAIPLHSAVGTDQVFTDGFIMAAPESRPLADDQITAETPGVAPADLVAAGRDVPTPAGDVPLLQAFLSRFPDAQQAVDALLTRLNELGKAAVCSPSSLAFAAWLAAAAGAAVETARRIHAGRTQGRTLLPVGGPPPDVPFPDEP